MCKSSVYSSAHTLNFIFRRVAVYIYSSSQLFKHTHTARVCLLTVTAHANPCTWHTMCFLLALWPLKPRWKRVISRKHQFALYFRSRQELVRAEVWLGALWKRGKKKMCQLIIGLRAKLAGFYHGGGSACPYQSTSISGFWFSHICVKKKRKKTGCGFIFQLLL